MKGSEARALGEGHRLYYHYTEKNRNGVGISLKAEFTFEVGRMSDRMMSSKIDISGVLLNFISAYAPQTGCEVEEKEMS